MPICDYVDNVETILYAPIMTLLEATGHSEKYRVSITGRVTVVRSDNCIYMIRLDYVIWVLCCNDQLLCRWPQLIDV